MKFANLVYSVNHFTYKGKNLSMFFLEYLKFDHRVTLTILDLETLA